MSADMTMRFNVDLDAPLVPRMASTLFVSGDNMANTIEVTLSKGGEPFNADGFSSALKMNRPDGEVVEMTDTTKNHVLTMTMTADFYAVPGYYTAKVKLINVQTGVRKTVLVLYGEILDDGGTPTIIPGNKLPADIESMLAMMEELREATADSRTAAQEARDAGNQAVADAQAAGAQAVAIAQEAANTANAAAAGVDEKVAEANAELAGKVSQLSEEMLTKADRIEADKSGSIVSVTDAAAQSAVQFISHIEPVQEGEGDPSPDNVRPISGWDNVKARRTGENLFNGDEVASRLDAEHDFLITKNEENKKLRYTANAISNKVFHDKFKANTQYTFIFYGKNVTNGYSSTNLSIRYTDGTSAGELRFPNENEDSFFVFTTPPGKSVALLIGAEYAGVCELYYEKCGIFEGVLTEADFKPYQDQTLTADLPEMVYGGTLDWGTGVLTVDTNHYIITGDEDTSANTTHCYVSGLSLPHSNGILSDGWCSHFGYRLWGNDRIGIVENGTSIILNDHSNIYADNDAWKTFLQTQYRNGTPVTIVYKLANPRIVQLTPQQLDMLRGTNNVWSDCGDTSLVYVADTKMYIDGKFAELNNAILAMGANI